MLDFKRVSDAVAKVQPCLPTFRRCGVPPRTKQQVINPLFWGTQSQGRFNKCALALAISPTEFSSFVEVDSYGG